MTKKSLVDIRELDKIVGPYTIISTVVCYLEGHMKPELKIVKAALIEQTIQKD